jgi:hypothetical protein
VHSDLGANYCDPRSEASPDAERSRIYYTELV